MSQSIRLEATKRELTGRKVRRLRKESIIPANVFSKGKDSKTIQVKADDFHKVHQEVGETGIVNLVVNEGKPLSVLVSEVQYHPVTMDLVHVDFREVDLKVKITTNVPIELIGEAPAEELGAIIVQSIDEVEVEALPGDLPESIQVDISKLIEVGDTLEVSTLIGSIPNIEITTEADTVIVSAQEVKEEVEEVEVETEADVAESAETPDGDATEADSTDKK